MSIRSKIVRHTVLAARRPFIAALSTNFKGNRYKQKDVADLFLRFTRKSWPDFPFEKQLLSMFEGGRIGQRTMHFDPVGLFFPPGREDLSSHQHRLRALACAPLIETARKVMSDTHLQPEDLKVHVFHSTDSATPSYDVTVNNQLNISASVKRDVIGSMGCVGGIASLWNAVDYLRSREGGEALVSVSETCSQIWDAGMNGYYADLIQAAKTDMSRCATMVRLLPDTGEDAMIQQFKNMWLPKLKDAWTPAAIFGDGAASLMLMGPCHPKITSIAARGEPLAHLIDFASITAHRTENTVHLESTPSGIRVNLSSELPSIVEAHFKPLVDNLIRAHEIELSDIAHWMIHPGGPKILRIVEAKLGLKPWATKPRLVPRHDANYANVSKMIVRHSHRHDNIEFDTEEERVEYNLRYPQLRHSWESLADNGNCGCVSVIDVMDRTIRCKINPPKRGDYGIAVAVGPGVTLEAVLVQW